MNYLPCFYTLSGIKIVFLIELYLIGYKNECSVLNYTRSGLFKELDSAGSNLPQIQITISVTQKPEMIGKRVIINFLPVAS